MPRDRQPSCCKDCGGEIAFVRCKSKHPDGRPKFACVQIVRRDGTATDPSEMYSQRRHIRHDEVCPWAERHRGSKAQRIADRASAPRPPKPKKSPPPVGTLSDETLAKGRTYYRLLKKRTDEQRDRLAEIEAEIDRRKKSQQVETIKPGFPWGDT